MHEKDFTEIGYETLLKTRKELIGLANKYIEEELKTLLPNCTFDVNDRTIEANEWSGPSFTLIEITIWKKGGCTGRTAVICVGKIDIFDIQENVEIDVWKEYAYSQLKDFGRKYRFKKLNKFWEK